MEVKATGYRDREYSVEEIINFFQIYDPEKIILNLAHNICQVYSSNSQDFINMGQFVPSLFNCILLYSKGKKETFPQDEFRKAVAMANSAYNLKRKDQMAEDTSVILQDFSIKVNKFSNFIPFVFGRLGYIFNFIEIRADDFSFSRESVLKVEDIFLPLFGSFSLGLANKNTSPIFDPSFFYSRVSLDEKRKKFLSEWIDNNLSIDFRTAKIETEKYLQENGHDFCDQYCVFESKPFLKIDDKYVLTSPHFGISNLNSVCAKLFIAGFPSKHKSEAEDLYGRAFEEYICSLIGDCLYNTERVPLYGNKLKNKGVDLISIKKNSIPVFIEVNKQVLWKSLWHDFSLPGFEVFLRERIVTKFEQIFKWLASINFTHKNINILKNIYRAQFIVCIPQDIPVVNLDNSIDLITTIVNDSWLKIATGLPKLKPDNIFILGANEIELLTTYSKKAKINPSFILQRYRNYQKKTKEVSQVNGTLNIRETLSSWLIKTYGSYHAKDNPFISRYEEQLISKVRMLFIAKKP